jgi:hypothetical protein
MMEVETCQVGLALATLAVSQKTELDLVPVNVIKKLPPKPNNIKIYFRPLQGKSYSE